MSRYNPHHNNHTTSNNYNNSSQHHHHHHSSSHQYPRQQHQQQSPSYQRHGGMFGNANTTTTTTTLVNPLLMGTKLFVASLPYSTRTETMLALFKPYGEILECKAVMENVPNTTNQQRCRGYGFVTYRDFSSALMAVEALNDKEFEGRKIKVDISREPNSSSTTTRLNNNSTTNINNNNNNNNNSSGGKQQLLSTSTQSYTLRGKPPLPDDGIKFPEFPQEPESNVNVLDFKPLESNTSLNDESDQELDEFGNKKRRVVGGGEESINPESTNNRIYVTGLPPNVTEDELQEVFGKLGTIARIRQQRGYPDQWPWKINIYKDEKGNQKGDASISYTDPNAASAAPSVFNGVDIRGSKIHVELAKEFDVSILRNSRGGGRGSAYYQSQGR